MRTLETMNIWSEPSTSSPKPFSFRTFKCHKLHANCSASSKLTSLHNRKLLQPAHRLQSRLSCKSQEDSGNQAGTASEISTDDRIKQTLAGLDALLGIEEGEKIDEDKENQKEGDDDADAQQDLAQVTFSKQVIDAISKAEAERLTQGKASTERGDKEQAISEKMAKILAHAKKMSESSSRNEGNAGMEREMQSLFTALLPETGVSKKHQQQMRDKVFGPTSFYVTEIRPLSSLRVVNLNSPSASSQELIQSSILVRGNLRAPKEEVFEKICSSLEREFGSEYTALMVTDPEAEESEVKGSPRVAFQIANSSIIQPQESRGWQKALGLLLGALTLATVLQVGLTANISQLPKVAF